jgi:hypothetical protein
MRLAADCISSPGASGAVRGSLLSNLFPETRAILLRFYDKQNRVGWRWSANGFHLADIHGAEEIKAHAVLACSYQTLFFLPMMTYLTMERINVVSHRAREEHATTITRNMHSLPKRDKQIRHGQAP